MALFRNFPCFERIHHGDTEARRKRRRDQPQRSQRYAEVRKRGRAARLEGCAVSWANGDGKLARGRLFQHHLPRQHAHGAVPSPSSRILSVAPCLRGDVFPIYLPLRPSATSVVSPISPICGFYTGASAECKSNRNQSWPPRTQSAQRIL